MIKPKPEQEPIYSDMEQEEAVNAVSMEMIRPTTYGADVIMICRRQLWYV